MRQSGLRLRALREAIGAGQDAFAALLGVERTTYANWEHGTRLVSVMAMIRLYEKVGIPLEWVYCGSLRQMPYDLAQKLEHCCATIGAVIGGPIAEWPMATTRKPGTAGLRAPAAVPKAKPRRSGFLHDKNAN